MRALLLDQCHASSEMVAGQPRECILPNAREGCRKDLETKTASDPRGWIHPYDSFLGGTIQRSLRAFTDGTAFFERAFE